jgi:hypothetical protein
MCVPQGQRVRVVPLVERVQQQAVQRAVEWRQVRALSSQVLLEEVAVPEAVAWVRAVAASSL